MRAMKHNTRPKFMVARQRLIRQLLSSDKSGAARAALTLVSCTPKMPCRSAACPVCGLAFQAAAVAVVDTFIRGRARAIRNRMTALTIVPASGCLPPAELSVEDFKRVGAEIATALEALDLPATIIGLEASFNEDTTGRFEDHWCVHGHGLQRDWLSKAQTKALRAAFPSSERVQRPILCVPLDQEPEGRLYPFKPERFRRVTRLITDHRARAPYRKSKPYDLRPWQASSLAIVEHQFGFARRLVTHGIDETAFEGLLRALGWARDGP